MTLRNVYIILCATACSGFAANTPHQQSCIDAAWMTTGVQYNAGWDNFAQLKTAQVPLLLNYLRLYGGVPAVPGPVAPDQPLNNPHQQSCIDATAITPGILYNAAADTFSQVTSGQVSVLFDHLKQCGAYSAPVAVPGGSPGDSYSALLGPTYLTLSPGAPDTRPTVYLAPSHPSNPSLYYWRINPYEIAKSSGPAPDTDFWSDVGQVAYIPEDANGAGIDRVQTFAYYSHAYAISPRIENSPDPSSLVYWINGAQTTLKHPVAATRNVGMTTNEGLIVYANGFIGIGGTQTSRGSNAPFDWPLPGLQLPAGKVPSAIAITTSNEFALVTVKDTATGRGQLAVIALEGHCIQYHTFQWIGLPNEGSWSDMKLMGYIDLPFNNPDSVSAATNGHWMGVSATAGKTLGMIDIKDAGTRYGLRQGELGWAGIVATGGYAIVSSKTDGKAAFINLAPLMQWIRSQYLDDDKQAATLAKFNWISMSTESGTRLVPRATPAFPGVLTVANTPTVVTTITVNRPTCSLSGHVLDRWSQDTHKAYIATESGLISIIDTSSLLNRWSWEKWAPLSAIGTIQVGANPVSMCFARFQQWGTPLLGTGSADGLNNIVHVACRGSRTVESFVTMMGTSQVYQRISDSRLQDPVCVSVGDRGNILTVCDYNGKQILNYRIGPLWDRVDTWGAVGQRFDPGAPGVPVNYECGGVLKLAGRPFWSGSNNLN